MSLYTTSSLFLQSLSNAGITYLFVNWGSDHPALLEDLQRQRVFSSSTNPTIITCPNEMVALSCAQGYAQVTGRPAGVIVHVDVGTQALAGAVHNVDRARVPVVIYAGASPVGSHRDGGRGTRNEWILWLQDIPDQPAILRQYMRHTVQIEAPLVVPKIVRRALRIAVSEPKGPVYIWARREVMEAEVAEDQVRKEEEEKKGKVVKGIEPSGLSPKVLEKLTSLLLSAHDPLILTTSLGSNPRTAPPLKKLVETLAIPVIQVCPNVVNLGWDSPCCLGVSYCAKSPSTTFGSRLYAERIQKSDVILILDCLLPWIPENLKADLGDEQPLKGKKVVWIDSGDILGRTQGNRHLLEDMGLDEEEDVTLAQADGEVLLGQVFAEVEKNFKKQTATRINERMQQVKKENDALMQELNKAEERVVVKGIANNEETASVPHILATLKNTASAYGSKPLRVLYLNEAISNYPLVWSHLRPENSGDIITSGGSSLGWGLGAAVGASLAGDEGNGKWWDLIVLIVGDGSFLFGVPGSVYWMARRYNTPFLTIVLNNSGWRSPRNSMAAVHPQGYGMGHLTSPQGRPTGDTLSVGFGPVCPDYVGIARGASGGDAPWTSKSTNQNGQGPWLWGKRIGSEDVKPEEQELKIELQDSIKDAVRAVVDDGRCAVLDILIDKV